MAKTSLARRNSATRIPSLDELVSNVKEILDTDIGGNDKKAWTKFVAEAFRDLLPEGCVGYGRYCGKSEYLCDQVWAIESPTEWSYRGLALVMECEWGASEDLFLDDYCKVLDVSADLRVFIGNLSPKKYWPNRIKTIETARGIAKTHRFFGKDDQVAVFICKQGSEDEDVECWIIRGDGRAQRRF